MEVDNSGSPVGKTRHNISLSSDGARIFDSLGRGNASAYIEAVLLQAEAEWRAAVSELRAHGWRYGEILLVCERVPPIGAVPRRWGADRFGVLLVQTLRELAQTGWGPAVRMAELLALVQAQRHVVVALDVVALELAMGNQRLREVLVVARDPVEVTR